MFDEEPAAFTAILPFPHPKVKNIWKEHRTVTLPDYQGFGLGNRLSEFAGEWLHKRGKKFRSVTSHPAMIGHRHRSKAWIMDRAPIRVKPQGKSATVKNLTKGMGRLTASFLYVPENRREIKNAQEANAT